MNTVSRYTDPHNTWWRYLVRVETPGKAIHIKTFANAQAAADWLETYHPGKPFHWNTNPQIDI